jgi:hypothetical protein
LSEEKGLRGQIANFFVAPSNLHPLDPPDQGKGSNKQPAIMAGSEIIYLEKFVESGLPAAVA